jgi:GTPase SAR1 family protein
MFNQECIVLGVSGESHIDRRALVFRFTKGYSEEFIPTVIEDCDKSLVIDGRQVQLIVFNCYHSPVQAGSLAGAGGKFGDVIALVFSVASMSSFNDVVEQWVPRLAQLFPGKPIVLVGTDCHVRESTDEEVLRAMVTFSREQGAIKSRELGFAAYCECTPRPSGGVEEVFDEVVRVKWANDLEKPKKSAGLLSRLFARNSKRSPSAATTTPSAEPTAPAHESIDKKTTDASTAEAPPGIPAAGSIAEALYDYSGDSQFDLSFTKGDMITIVKADDVRGWWTGELAGNTGLFPSNYSTIRTGPPSDTQRVDSALDVGSVVAQQRSVMRAPTKSPGTTITAAPVVLDVDWQLVLSQSGLQSQLASMQAAIAANDRAQLELRAADAQLDSRVAANATLIAEHHERLAELEQHRHIQSTQLDILRALQHKPAQLLFYRTLLINMEAVFLSCKAVMGGFVDLGGDAASSKALTGAAKATKVCGTVLSLLPGGALIKGAANLTAAALEQANASRRQNIVMQLGKNLTQAEASQVASDVAHRLTVAFAAQLELLAPIEQSGEGSSGSGGFLSFLKSTCGVGGKLAAAYVTSGGDGSEVIATAVELAKDAASEQATELLATKFGALVGSVENGPDPFASVLADFCFLCALAELENVRARETPNEIAERLVHAVLELKPTAAPSAQRVGRAPTAESIARRDQVGPQQCAESFAQCVHSQPARERR